MAYTTIDNGEENFNTILWSGNGNDDRNLTGVGFAPDWVWIQARTGSHNNYAYDSSRGANKQIIPAESNAESDTANKMQEFQSDGFQVGSSDETNKSTSTYVAWNWKANGGTTSSNSDGGITSTVQANTTAGFSIVTYTGTGSATTVGHGLGATPKLVIVKERGNGNSWLVQSNLFSSTNFVTFFNRSDTGGDNDSTTFNGTFPTSSVFSVGTHTGTNRSSGTYVAYCFANIKGYSKIGTYKGNNSADAPFIHTGFKPAWFLAKDLGSGNAWLILDNKRDDVNPVDLCLLADNSAAESDEPDQADFLSNGIKLRANNSDARQSNNDGNTYIYMAFAEHPFVSSKGVPVTAR